MNDASFAEMLRPKTIDGKQLVANLEAVTSGVLESLDTSVDPEIKPTEQITNDVLIETFERLGELLRLPDGVIRNGIRDFEARVNNKIGEN